MGIGLASSAAANIEKHLTDRGFRIHVVPYDDPGNLVSSLEKNQVDCAVRGTLGSLGVLEAIKRTFSTKQVMRTAIMEDARGKQFLLTPVGIDEGLDKESRLDLVDFTLMYFSNMGWRISVGILSKGRPDDWRRSPEIEKSLKDGEWLLKELRTKGVDAEHHSILIENAVARSDLVLAPDGVSGNLIFRSMHFLGGGKAFGAPVVNIDPVFVDTSRSKSDFSEPVLLAAGLFQARSGSHR